MKPNLFVATLALAFALIIGCSSGNDDGGEMPNNEVGSSSSLFTGLSSSDISSSSYASSSSFEYSSSSSSEASSYSSSIDLSSSSSAGNDGSGTHESVTIGSQVWMKKNLNIDAAGSKCYDDDPANCDKYGRLYTWEEAMAACLDGWHLPTNAEWDALFRYADGDNGTENPYDSETAGKHLKAESGWYQDGNGEDTHGFTALPGGYGYSDGGFDYVDIYGYWWSASEHNGDNAYYRGMGYNGEGAYWYYGYKANLRSVRCVKD